MPVIVVENYKIVESYLKGELQATPVVIVGGGGTSDVDKAYVDAADLVLQQQIDANNAEKFVVTIQQTKADLDLYATIDLITGDSALVLVDETQVGTSTIYNWNGTIWEFIGSTAISYSKSEVDALLLLKADISSVYLKSEIDDKLNLKADIADTYNKTEINQALLAIDIALLGKVEDSVFNSSQEIQDNRLNKLELPKYLEVTSLDTFTGALPTVATLVNLQNVISSSGGIVVGADGGISFPENGTYDIRIRYNLVASSTGNRIVVTGVGTTNLASSIIKNRTETINNAFSGGIAQTQTLNIKVIITNFATEKRYIFINSSGGTINFINNALNSPISIVVTK